MFQTVAHGPKGYNLEVDHGVHIWSACHLESRKFRVQSECAFHSHMDR